jgi:hypothetical protein
MDGRTIPLLGGGELTIGGEPLIDGLIQGWVRNAGANPRGDFMIEYRDARDLVELLGDRHGGRVAIFAGELRVSFTRSRRCVLWFYAWEGVKPDFAARLENGAVDRLIDLLGELLEDRVGRVA